MNDEEKNMAVLVHVLSIFIGVISPVIFYFITDNKKAFAKEHAKESLNFGITVIIGYIIASVLMVVLIGFILMPLLLIFNLIFCIIAAVAASKGEKYKFPVSIRLIK